MEMNLLGALSLTPAITQAVFALILALLLGTVIGFERQVRNHPAGLHTNALVCAVQVLPNCRGSGGAD